MVEHATGKKRGRRSRQNKKAAESKEEQLEEFLFGRSLKRKELAEGGSGLSEQEVKRKKGSAGPADSLLWIDRAPAPLPDLSDDEEGENNDDGRGAHSSDSWESEREGLHTGSGGSSDDSGDDDHKADDDGEDEEEDDKGRGKEGSGGMDGNAAVNGRKKGHKDDDRGEGAHEGDESDGDGEVEVDGGEDGDGGGELEEDTGGDNEGLRRNGAGAGVGPGSVRSGRAAAWQDSDDDEVEVEVKNTARLRKLRTSEEQTKMAGAEYVSALRKQHQTIHGPASWAQLPDTREESEAGAQLLRSAAALTGPSIAGGSGRSLLPPRQLEVSRVSDANQTDPSSAVVQSVDWHPNAQLLLTAGMDKRLRLFQVDGVHNERVQSLFLEDMPVRKAAFVAGGALVLAAGRRAYTYLVDVEAGAVTRLAAPLSAKQGSLETFSATPAALGAESSMAAFLGDVGRVQLLSLKTRTWVTELKMNGTARVAAFSPDGRELLTAGSDGMVYTWDLRMRRCLDMARDEGGFNPTSLALSADRRHWATGSGSGVVNVYDAAAGHGPGRNAGSVRSTPPLKALTNLFTSVDSLVFSPDSQMLAMATRLTRDSLRVVHLPSLTAFANWPTSGTPLHYVHSVAFSPNCGFLAIGNAKGRVLLYRLHHYPQA